MSKSAVMEGKKETICLRRTNFVNDGKSVTRPEEAVRGISHLQTDVKVQTESMHTLEKLQID